MSLDYLIVGAGLFGATFCSHAVAAGKSCLVIDKRSHIGGNVFTKYVDGITVHVYGAHIFHTSDEKVWKFLNKFASFNGYVHRVAAEYEGRRYSLPFNMHTFKQLWGVQTPEEAQAVIAFQRAAAGIDKVSNLEEQAISEVGTEIYEKLIKGYTEKQWGRPCRELPPSIIKRLPLRFTYDDAYFDDIYQGIPTDGYTSMVEKMLRGAEVRLNTDYGKFVAESGITAKKTVYTGMLDEFFKYRLGALQYRSLRFETSVLDMSDFQGRAVVNYTSSKDPYTRIIEHRHFTGIFSEKTVVSKEFPDEYAEGKEAFYTVNDENNEALAERYRDLAAATRPDVLFGGRLGEYKYLNMDETVASAIRLAQSENLI